jgi:hypothetical protein
MCNLLKCELCDYTAKQLFQHIKVVHNISVDEYRDMFGVDKVMQINFNPPIADVDKKISTYVSSGHLKIKNKIKSINEIYNKDETIELLKTKFYYKNYFGRAKNRTLIKENPKLYKSIYYHTNNLEYIFTENNKGDGNFNFTKRLIFLVEFNTDIEKLKCECGKSYTWNSYCRKCPSYHKTWIGKTHTASTKYKMRKSTLKYLEDTNGQLVPRYNKKSISILEDIAIKLGINDLQHAENGGEFYIKELGYWVDGYSPSKNIVIEYDERHHFDCDGNLRDRDINRQIEIEKYLNCKFVRIAEL